MSSLTPFGWLLVVWGVVTTALVLLVIVKSVIGFREDDQLFLDPAEATVAKEQEEVQNQLARIAPYVKGFGFASAGLAAMIVALIAYRAVEALL